MSLSKKQAIELLRCGKAFKQTVTFYESHSSQRIYNLLAVANVTQSIEQIKNDCILTLTAIEKSLKYADTFDENDFTFTASELLFRKYVKDDSYKRIILESNISKSTLYDMTNNAAENFTMAMNALAFGSFFYNGNFVVRSDINILFSKHPELVIDAVENYLPCCIAAYKSSAKVRNIKRALYSKSDFSLKNDYGSGVLPLLIILLGTNAFQKTLSNEGGCSE